MNRLALITVTIFAAAILCSPGIAEAAASLTVTMGQHTVTASGITPGGSVAFFGIAQVPMPHAYMNRIQRWSVIVEVTGHEGTATLDLNQDVPPMSVWAVVDLGNAHYATASGPGLGLREVELSNPFRKGQSGTIDTFAFDHSYLDLLYVHPGRGAWTWSALAGLHPDRGDRYGSTVVTLSDAKPLGSSGPPPSSYVPGGILVAVDVTRMEIAVARLDGAILDGVR
jgi:hypothetical protein